MIPHDFFQPQPVKEPGVFILNNILHNNGKSRCITILKLLRDAAGPQTKLLIGEQVRYLLNGRDANKCSLSLDCPVRMPRTICLGRR